MTKWILHYAALASFKSSFYKNHLTLEHLKGGMVSIEKFTYADGREGEFTIWGWELQKGNEKYILPCRMGGGEEVKLNTVLPIIADDTEKIAYKGQVANLIRKPKSKRWRPVAHLTFKQLVDKLSSTPHSNPEHHKLLWFIGLASSMDRVYFRVCSPPSFGKSSVVDTVGHLLSSATKVVKPTLAKLEHRTNYSWLVLDEANDLPSASWKEIDQFFLDVAAFSPSIEKHSMGPKQNYDVSKFSISMFYNDVTDYPDKSEYFDTITKKALRDRFPALRVHGGFTADFNEIRSLNIHEYVEENIQAYRELIETYTYYEQKFHSQKFRYEVRGLQNMPERWKINVDKLLKVIDLYCDSQEEFDKWVKILSDCIQDYYEMGKWPALYERAKKKYSAADLDELKAQARKLATFKEKNELIANYDGVVFNKQVKGW